MLDYKSDFISYALSCGVLKFGQFRLKSGRISPYFLNTGLFNTGAKLGKLGEFYAQALLQSELKVDILYGPAYKGIPLVATVSIAYAQLAAKDIPFVFNRKEAKDHGEGGDTVGAKLEGRVLIVDDVITAGTSVRESVEVISRAGAIPAGVLIALDRQEKAETGRSAIQDIIEYYKIPVVSIITLADIICYIEKHESAQAEAISVYRQRYGVS